MVVAADVNSRDWKTKVRSAKTGTGRPVGAGLTVQDATTVEQTYPDESA